MRFTEAKKGRHWLLIILIFVIGIVLFLGFCQFQPTLKTVQKTIVFETD